MVGMKKIAREIAIRIKVRRQYKKANLHHNQINYNNNLNNVKISSRIVNLRKKIIPKNRVKYVTY